MVHEPAGPDVFDAHLAAWRAWQREPWGRLRYAVVWHVLQRHLAELDISSRPLRILDVGAGDGTEALRLASLGHSVTLVDSSAAMLDIAHQAAVEQQVDDRLASFESSVQHLDDLDLGQFDLVLCHFVIQYLEHPADADAVAAAARHLSPDGILSLVAPNPAAEVLAKAVRELDFGTAKGLLRADTFHTETFDHDVARISPEKGERFVQKAGLSLVQRYGGRIVMDLIRDNAPTYDADSFAALERLEIALCGLSPFRDIGRFWQLIARRSSTPAV